MSGGHWGYQSFNLAERADKVHAALLLVAESEHELDWGISNDTCLDCAMIRVGAAWIEYFENDETATVALSVMRDSKQNQCHDCIERFGA